MPRPIGTQMTQDFQNGFTCGVIWAVARLTDMRGDMRGGPATAKELCKKAGISIQQLRKADVADRRSHRRCDKEVRSIKSPR